MTADPLADAREHVDNAYYYAAGIGRDEHTAVAEIDAALRLLYAARERIVVEHTRRVQALMDQLAAYDTYRDNLRAVA